ncbi:DNA-directed RNA polymerase IV subunit 1 isoform X1 [Arachis duranensis]|uniref:DNA-directed RNA polymerase subunit n=1 Tax=Arachis duranensis TaxID=130453 RepID=A0A6P4DBJ0_ARADU|nr:DNA-directed RNA polymerase IV subunit 1 isoform X1 [Arachis duranensis]
MDDNLFNDQVVPSGRITGIKFGLLTEEDIENASTLEIQAAGQVNCSDLGLPNPTHECTTCGSKDRNFCEGHYGVIKFNITIPHPYFLSEIAQLLNKICPACKSIREELRSKGAQLLFGTKRSNGCKYCSGNSYPKMKFRVSSNDLFRRTAIIVEINERSLNSKKHLGRRVPEHFWDFIPSDPQQEESCIKPNRRALSPYQVLCLLSDVDQDFVQKFVPQTELLGLNCFPVTPNCHRVTEVMHAFSNANRLSFDNRTRACKKLVDFRGTATELISRVLDCLRISKLHPDKTPANSFADIQQKKNAENACNSSGLRWMKDVVLGKRNDSSFRTVVVGDPDLEPGEIGIPCQIAESLQVSEYVNKHNLEKLLYCGELRMIEKGNIKVRRKGSPIVLYKKEDLQIGDLFYRPLGDGDKVLINRPPSIHQHSMIALSVKVLPISSAVSINPLCCSPLRGDFDGDCLHGYIPDSVAARVELSELVSLEKQLINGQSGKNLLSLSQDSLTAAHLLMEDGVLLNVYQMQQLQMFCAHNLTPPAIVKAPSSNTSFWTGKQLFSMLLPSNLDYSFPSNGVSVRNGELLSSSEASGWLRDSDCNLFQSLVEQCQGDTLDFLYAAQKVLCEWLSMTGFTVSLADLYLASDSYARKNMMEEISFGLQEAEHSCNFKQLLVDSCCDFLAGNVKGNEKTMIDVVRMNYERQISAALSQESVDAFRQVFRNIQGLADRYGEKDNSFLAMIKAGSKGNLLKLVQHSMCLGLQHSLVRLSFRIPHQLSCAAWNSEKGIDSVQKFSSTPKSVQSYIPYAVVEGSFLSGLNPLECFVHSVTNRDSSFSDNADLPGTLSRRLMFFMRDICGAYDGTVRNLYGNQIVQFYYDTDEDSPMGSCSQETTIGGEPVGALAACAISEAAYSALGQPISLLETSPLLNLKSVLECGSKKKSGDQTVSLFLSAKFRDRRYGFEYAAFDVKNYLERIMFSDIVSTVMIIFTSQSRNQEKYSPWVCHFHLDKEIVRRRNLKLCSIINSLKKRCGILRKESKVCFASMEISLNRKCSAAYMSQEGKITSTDKGMEGDDCITVTLVEYLNNSIPLDDVRDFMLPSLLGTTVKGFPEITKVDILWNSLPKSANFRSGCSGELYLRITMSSDNSSGRFWGVLINHCLPIMHMIDWTRSLPDNINHFCSAYGIDAGWKYFLQNLASATTDTGKTVLHKHLRLVADSLSVSGEFVGLNGKGMARQRQHASVSSPFVQACFSNPGSCFIKSAKAGVKDDLQGILDALAWGNCPPLGTSGQFEIIYSPKGQELAKSGDVYKLLKANFDQQIEKSSLPTAYKYSAEKWSSNVRPKNGGFGLKVHKQLKSLIRNFVTVNDIYKLTSASRNILNKYSIDEQLNEKDLFTMLKVLHFHPHRDEKYGSGPQHIKVGWHPEHKTTRCFFIERTDGTVEDFSYRKCILGALEIVAPDKAKTQKKKWKKDE